jgi:amidohydrolase
MTVKTLIEKYQNYAVRMRREFHQHPEASMKEFRTQKRVMEELDAMGIEHYAAGGTGVIGLIHGKSPGRTVALRADMDALEIQEENDVPYKSLNQGLMHACGHDGHTAALLTAARILKDLGNTFDGTVKLLFQPGEETGQGALAMIDDHVMEGVDGIFGIHLMNDIEVGKISVDPGPRLASAGMFKIYVTGKGGHGSMPQQSVDAAVVGASILLNLQSIVSREISPLDAAVVSVGVIKSGTRFNIIAGEAYLEGTTRCFSHEINDAFEEQIRRVAENTAQAYRATARVEYQKVVIPTVNDLELSIMASKTVESLFGSDAIFSVPQSTGGEDFSYYSKYAPSMFALVGTQNIKKLECFPHHHSKFDIDEDALAISAGLYAQLSIDFLK